MWVTDDNRILHEFYQKDISSKAVVHARSSLPWSAKRTVLTQEILRILLRCSPDLPWNNIKNHVEIFIARMQYSGYNKRFRAEVLHSAREAYKEITRKDKQGEQPLYRPKQRRQRERKEQRRNKKSNWYKKGGNMSVLFIPATPTSKLKKMFEEEIRQSKLGIKVVEKSGRSIKALVQRTDPFNKGKCRDKEGCFICREKDSKGRCRITNTTYEIRCRECNMVYHGETGRNGYTRGQDHLKALEKGLKDSVLQRHIKTEHQDSEDNKPKFSMQITGTHKSALDRQLTEAVKINNTGTATLINNKEEFGHNKIWKTNIQY